MFIRGPFQFFADFECGNIANVVETEPSEGCTASQLCTACHSRLNPKQNLLTPNSKGTKGTNVPSNKKNTEHNPKENHPSSRIDSVGEYSPEPLADHEFQLFTRPDCANTPFENVNRTWFFFSITGGNPGKRVRLRVMNLNKQVKLYSQGMKPVWLHLKQGENVSLATGWTRLSGPVHCWSADGSAAVSWMHTVPEENLVTYYAFTFPFSYSLLQKQLSHLDARYTSVEAENPKSAIYYVREVAIKSLDGHNLDLLTVSSRLGMSEQREEFLPGLFPDRMLKRPFKFKNKKIVFVSSRVHPGETPASFVFNGFLEFILSNDPRARKLRDTFVFKLVPMLNPDGVFRGNYRSDLRGVNLNRVYTNPSYKYHPTIFAARNLLLYYHSGKIIPVDEDCLAKTVTSTPKSASKLSILDENACHSFSEAAEMKPDDRTIVSHANMEIDEPSNSGWDVSSNMSLDSTIHTNSMLFRAPEMPDTHDDCSNISGLSEAETGVSSLFGTLGTTQITQDNSDAASSCSSSRMDVKKSPVVKGPTTRSLSRQGNPLPKHSSQKNLLTEKNLKLHCDATSQSLPSTHKNSSSFPSPHIFTSSLFSDTHTPPPSKSMSPMLRCSRITGGQKVEKSSENNNSMQCKVSEKEQPGDVFAYVDLHGHASKRGIFLYGNWFADVKTMVDNLLLAKVLSLNCTNFDFNGCNFSQKNMSYKDRKNGLSKEGCGRVAIMRLTGILRSYTLECNYNTGRVVNKLIPLPAGCPQSYECDPDSVLTSVSQELPAAQREEVSGPLISSAPIDAEAPPFIPVIFEDCGRELAVTLLDIETASINNELSRIPRSTYGSVNGVKSWIRQFLTTPNNAGRPIQLMSTTPAKLSPITSQKSKIGKRENKCSDLPTQSPKLLRSRSFSKTRKSSRTPSIDAENREPTAGGSKTSTVVVSRVKSQRTKSLSPKKGTPRSITFPNQDKSIPKAKKKLNKIRRISSVGPNVQPKPSVSEALESPVLISKLEKLQNERKVLSSVSDEKHKHNLNDSEAYPEQMDNPSTSFCSSPRSPLSCVFQGTSKTKTLKCHQKVPLVKHRSKIVRSISKSMEAIITLHPGAIETNSNLSAANSTDNLTKKKLVKRKLKCKKKTPEAKNKVLTDTPELVTNQKHALSNSSSLESAKRTRIKRRKVIVRKSL